MLNPGSLLTNWDRLQLLTYAILVPAAQGGGQHPPVLQPLPRAEMIWEPGRQEGDGEGTSTHHNPDPSKVTVSGLCPLPASPLHLHHPPAKQRPARRG